MAAANVGQFGSPTAYMGALQAADSTMPATASLSFGQDLQAAHTPAGIQQLTVGYGQTQAFSSQFQPQSQPTVIANYALPQLIASHTTPQLVANQTTPRLVANQMTPRLVANHTTPQLVVNQTNHTTQQLISNHTTPQLVAKQATPQLVVANSLAPGQNMLVTSLNGQVPVWPPSGIQPQYTAQLSTASPASSTGLAQIRYKQSTTFVQTYADF